MKLKISDTLSLPLDFVTSTQAILAKKGKGKTYKASVQAEELLANGQRERDSLAEAISWEPGGSNLRNRLSELSALELVDYPAKGSVALQSWVTA